MEPFVGALIRRPVAVASCYALVAALAVASLLRLPVALLPALRYPALVVWTAVPDADPQKIERTVTEPVEEAVAGTGGLSGISSRSQLGGSLVRLDFGWGADLDLAALDVREKLDRTLPILPDRAARPVVLRVDPSDRPVMVLALSPAGGRAGGYAGGELVELKRLAQEVVARRLEQLDGVARVRVTGGDTPEVEVEISPTAAAAYGVDLSRAAEALADANVTLSGGVIRRGPFRYSVEVGGELRAASEVAETIVSAPGKPPVRLRQIAKVEAGASPRRGLVRLDGREVLLLLVERRPEANTVETVGRVKEALSELAARFPGVRLEPVVDESAFIREAIAGLAETIVLGAVLSVVVLLLFVRQPRSLAAVALAIPASLALSLVLFDLLGVSLNLVSLSGLSLGVGMLADNAILVVENAARLRAAGLDAATAARRGTADVFGAVNASTVTTLAVFLPLSFAEGLAGRLFRDQSIAVCCSVGASLVVAATAVPLVVARGGGEGGAAAPERAGRRIAALFTRAVAACLARPGAVVAASLAALLAGGWLALRLPRASLPEAEQGRIEVAAALPTDADLPLVDERLLPVETAARALPGVEHVLADLGEHDDARLDLDPRPIYRGDVTLVLAPGAPSAPALARLLALPRPGDLALTARAVRPQLESLLSQGDADLVIDLASTRREAAEAAAGRLLASLARRRELAQVVRADPERVPAYRVDLDRDAMTRLAVRPEALAIYLETASLGREATRLAALDEEVPVVLRSPPPATIEELLSARLPVAGALLPLASFLRARPVEIPAVLLRRDQVPTARLLAATAPGATLQAAVGAIRDAARGALPRGVQLHVGGSAEAFRSALSALGMSLALSTLLVYLILAAQFESLWQPVLVLTTLPAAGAGVAAALALAGQSWNLMSLTACVILVGVAVNHAIVEVECLNQRRRSGLPLGEALASAADDRFRPIVMTTLTTVMGMLPLAMGIGAGARLQMPLAVAIIGGLLTSTAVALFAVPAVYWMAARLAARVERR